MDSFSSLFPLTLGGSNVVAECKTTARRGASDLWYDAALKWRASDRAKMPINCVMANLSQDDWCNDRVRGVADPAAEPLVPITLVRPAGRRPAGLTSVTGTSGSALTSGHT